MTFYQSLRDVDNPRGVRWTWEEILGNFATHHRADSKQDVPGFGPYEIVEAPGPCYHPRGVIETPHRCDACVTHLSMAVFDVDIGTPAQVQTCEGWLQAAGVTRLWYSSYSFDPRARIPSLRLVLPLSRPVDGDVWPSFRRILINKFQIPADPKKCGGRSHFYYVPSCPPGAEPLVDYTFGKFLDVDSIPAFAEARPSTRRLAEILRDWTPVEGEDKPVDLSGYHRVLGQAAERLMRKRDVEAKEKAAILRALVEGKQLAAQGSRDVTTTRAAMLVVSLLPEATLHELEVLFQDSLHAMMSSGSKLDESSIRRKIISAMRKHAEQELARAEFLKTIDAFTEPHGGGVGLRGEREGSR